MSELITLRNDPEQHRDITARSLLIRAETVNEEERSVEAVLATDGVVPVFDMRTFSVIDETLRMDGAELPESVPMLDSHQRFSLDNVFGSVRNMRVVGNEIICRLFFAKGGDDEEGRRIDRAWDKVRQGHLRNVSAGYAVREFTDVPPGKTVTIGGRQYTAGQRTLRVSTKWVVREGSLVPIGADPAATIRKRVPSATENETVNEQLRQYLESIGLRADATEQEAWEFFHALQSEQRAAADELLGDSEPPTPPASSGSQRSESTETTPPAPPANQPTEDQIRQQAVEQERQRQTDLRAMFGADAPELLERAISEGWTREQAAPELLAAVRRRSSPVNNATPAIHSRSHDTDCNLAALQGAMMLREGASLDNEAYVRQEARFVGIPVWLRSDIDAAERQQAMEFAHRYCDWSLIDFCREAIRLSGQSIPHSHNEIIQRALSTAELNAIFTTNVSAELLVGYMEAEDTTQGWVSESDVANFQSNERATMGKFGPLKKHARGGTAEDMDVSDSKEEYKIARFTGKFGVDEMDIIDDRFGAINQTSPREMGLSARQIRPDMVYSVIHANPTLQADSKALFHADHNNLVTTGSVLGVPSLEAGITSFGKQRIRNRPINLKPRFLIIPQDLKFKADQLLTSTERREADTKDGTKNTLQGSGLRTRVDDRMGAGGTVDPRTETSYTGSATNWLLAARPGENGAKTIEVGYRRGTGRAPQIRSFTLNRGQWGIGWDIKHDIGVKELDFRGLYKATGAS